MHGAGDPQPGQQHHHRDHRHVRAGVRRSSRSSTTRRPRRPVSAPLIVGLLVLGIGLSLGGPTGYAINPARDLGPRIMHAILPIAGKGDSDWGYAWVPVVGAADRRRARRGAFDVLPRSGDRPHRRAAPPRPPVTIETRRSLMAKYAAAIDQGTTSTRCMVFDHGGHVVSVAQKEHEQIYPKPGWVEHDVDGDLGAHAGGRRRGASPRPARARATSPASASPTSARPRSCGTSTTGEPIHNALVWQDTRTDKLVDEYSPATAGRRASRRRSACRWRRTSPARRSAGSSTTSTARPRRPSPATCCSATWTPG